MAARRSYVLTKKHQVWKVIGKRITIPPRVHTAWQYIRYIEKIVFPLKWNNEYNFKIILHQLLQLFIWKGWWWDRISLCSPDCDLRGGRVLEDVHWSQRTSPPQTTFFFFFLVVFLFFELACRSDCPQFIVFSLPQVPKWWGYRHKTPQLGIFFFNLES